MDEFEKRADQVFKETLSEMKYHQKQLTENIHGKSVKPILIAILFLIIVGGLLAIHTSLDIFGG